MMNVGTAERFESLRPLLVRHAYRMLGQYGDAEDVVQDAYLRWNDALSRGVIENDQAFLRTTVTHLCLDRLRSARAKREVYVGPWLPEPVVSPDSDPAEAASLADDISFALLLALERLAPLERAAFLLHDVLDVPFAEVAQTLGRAEPAVRKLASRAREHVRDANRRVADRAKAMQLRDAFLDALMNEDAAAMSELLAADVVFTSDGGGKVPAATVPVAGRGNVAALLVGLKHKGAAGLRRVELVTLNGMPGVLTFSDAGVDTAVALEIADGRIAAMYAVRNPDKLRAIAAQLSKSRP
ncbi:MAG TPA: RNA polymerase sigma factor SigJ [Candidatus Baltobacteraceae bacterium]|nr:RNA polymerase sigma factor SigJ [Candidatus Baltobacteraceae bacterium]